LAHDLPASALAAFYLRPNKPGPENKIIIHLAESLNNPLQSTLKASKSLTSPFEHGVKVLSQSPFNCFIRRDIDYLRDVISGYLYDCPTNTSPMECLEKQRAIKDFQCAAGSVSPICCYAKLLKNTTAEDPVTGQPFVEILSSIYGKNVSAELKKCSEPKNITDYEEECPAAEGLSQADKDKFYIFNRNLTCNPFLRASKDSCILKSQNELYTMPCLGRCLTGMLINLEITPTSSLSRESELETTVSIIQKYEDFNQRFYNVKKDSLGLTDPNEFGYSANLRSPGSNIQILKKRVASLPVFTGQWNGIWFLWKLRPPSCIKHSAENDILAPVLAVGMEGHKEPVFEIEFACTNFDGDENDARGWRFGWLARDILKPRLSAVWKPNYYAFNSIKDSKFTVSFGGNLIQCSEKRKAGPVPIPLIFAIIFVIILVIVTVLVCGSSKVKIF
jgi:hypothetical protein